MAPSRGLADRLKALDPRVFDAVLTVGLVLLGVGSQFGEGSEPDAAYRATDVYAVALGLAATVPVYWRRRSVLALVVSTVAVTLIGAFDYKTNQLPMATLFLTYANGAHAPRRWEHVGLVLPPVAIGLIWLTHPPDLDGVGAALNAAVFVGAWLAGQVMRARQAATTARLAEAEERAEAQRQQAARSIAEERLRIAQELHDVVAHSMSVIAVQAGMGVHVIESRPDEARRALEAISSTSRTTLNEMRRLLGVLRGDDGERLHEPVQGVADLPRLVDDVRAAGIPVDLRVEGDASAVCAGIELSIYRLVQEGLTNVIKHAGRASADVSIRYGEHAVEVEVTDDGRGAAAALAADGTGGGHGLLGMRERVAVWGGRFEAGARTGGGYRVHAELPYGDAP